MAASSISFQDANVSMEELLNDEELFVTEVVRGKAVQGKIVGFEDEEIIIDFGSKSEGRISLEEFDDKPEIDDHIEALVKRVDQSNHIVYLSKRELEQRRGWEVVKEAQESDSTVTGKVVKAVKTGYAVNIEGVLMFLPLSHVGIFQGNRKGGKKELIDSIFTFRILELNPKRKSGVVSRKAFQDEQNGVRWQQLGEKVKIGDIVEGKVTKHTKAGLFVEVHGIEGFLHRSNISWERKQDNFKEKLPLETETQFRVLEIDTENNRLALGIKQLKEDPWVSVLDKIQVNDVVKGRVSFVANYGAFVEMGEGLEGLLHVSEMSWTRKINHAQEILKLDQEIEAKVLGINIEDKRIALGLRQLTENPWESLKFELKEGQVRKGVVKDITNFGVFVSITDEIDGLIRKEDINWDEPAPDPRKVFESGQELEFKVTELNFVERKIGCSLRHLLPNPYKALRQNFPRGTVISGTVSGVVDFGVFIRFEEKYEGLAHISTMTKEDASSPKKVFKKGDAIQAVIKSIDPENRKISLSLKDVSYALEKIEIQHYIQKESSDESGKANPFAQLRDKLN